MELPSLPAGWRFAPVKRIAALQFSSVDKHSLPGEAPVRLCNYLDVYRNEHITRGLEFMEATASRSEIERFSLLPGDVLLTKDSEEPSDIGVPACVVEQLDGVICGYHLALARPRRDLVDARFLQRCLQATGIRDQFYSRAVGVTRFALGLSEVGDALVPVAPLTAQRSIAAFLDRKTAAIDQLIGKKERLIELLQEKRQALITQAVTKGLDPSAPMKDSGIESLGNIPTHWRATRLMHLTPVHRQIMYGIVLPGPDVEAGIPIVKSGNCIQARLRPELLSRTTPEIEAPFARARLRPDDIVYAIRGSIGMAAIVPADLEGANLTQDAARIAPRTGINPRWLLYAVQSHAVWSQLAAGVLGATVKGINIRDLKRPFVPAPPRHEQDLIVKELDLAVHRLDALSAATDESIKRLDEYRQALISAAVTGQIDVTGEAA
jgi:type I restriction enzyme, S subunit